MLVATARCGNQLLHTIRRGGAAACFARNGDGSAAVEYALFLAGIAAAVLFAVQGVEFLAARTFDVTAQGLAGETTAIAGAASTAAGNSGESASAPGSAQAAVPPAPGQMPASTLLLLVCSVSALGCYLHHCNQRRRAEAEQLDEQLGIDHDAVFEKRHSILRILSTDVGILFDSRMHVEHLMSRKIRTIEPSAIAGQVREQMQDGKIRHLMVCDKNGKLLGVISDRDLRKSQAKTAAELMTPDPITIEPSSLVSPAVTLLIKRRISCLPVVDGSRLVGVLTTTDLMMALQCALHALQKVASEIADVHTAQRSRRISEICRDTEPAEPASV